MHGNSQNEHESISPHHLPAEKQHIQECYIAIGQHRVLFHLTGDNIDQSLGCIIHIWTVFNIF